jgi:hypothetical protein
MEESGLGEDAEDGTRNAAYWKCMYERLRDVRETEAEKVREGRKTLFRPQKVGNCKRAISEKGFGRS